MGETDAENCVHVFMATAIDFSVDTWNYTRTLTEEVGAGIQSCLSGYTGKSSGARRTTV